MPDDLELLGRWAAGDREAAAELLERHLDPLARFFRSKVAGDVDDHVQESFTRCLALRKDLRPGSSFRAYLFAVARNLLYEYFRKTRRDVPLDPQEMSLVDLGASPSSALHRDREQRLMLAALRRIPLESQIALELHYWEELGIAEMADALEIPEGTVKSRLHRARQQLRARIEAMGSGDPELATSLSAIDAWDRAAL